MKQTVEKLAELMVLTDATDLPSLAGAHTLFEAIRDQAAEHDAHQAASIAQSGGDLIQAIILSEVDDAAASLQKVIDSVTTLQQLIVEGCDPSEFVQPSDGEQAADPEPSAAVVQPPAAAQPLTGDLELTGEFIAEAREHLDSADSQLLIIEANPADDDAVNALFRAFHTIKGVSGFLDLHDIQALAHQTENLLDAARQGKKQLIGESLDVVFDATDVMKQLIDCVAEAVSTGGDLKAHPKQAPLVARLNAIMTGRGAQASPPAAAVPQSEAPVTATTGHTEKASAGPPEAADSTTSAGTSRAQIALRETVKVDSARLDALVDSIGELVIAEAMVTQSPAVRSVNDEAMRSRLTQLSKITRELQEMATSLRMVPIKSTFHRMARLARDTAKKIDKQIEFVVKGEETELDKNVVDQIGDPLVHMVRNAVDHGLENSSEVREKAGKSPVGRVTLSAFHRGGSIYVQISDDGGGLDRERILAKAKERGIVREGDQLTDAEVYQLIMEPGFSTAKVVSDVSGRGVGMDVVKRNIQAMRGQLEISSEPGKGTTFSIRLPLTLAIIDGMVLRAGDRRYVLPLLSIRRMLRPEQAHVPSVFGQAEMLQTDEGLIPLHRLYELFQIPDAKKDPAQASVVVVEHDGRKIGLLVDELLGQQQIVIKSLGESLQGVAGVAGGAIMPDGKVGLILDLDSLFHLALSKSAFDVAA